LAVAVVLVGTVLGGALYPSLVRGVETAATLAPGNGWPEGTEVRVLDVGQGNAILVRTPGHHALLFDGGPAGCGLAGQLHTLGVRKLDMVVISHPHADHFAGLLEAVDSLEVGMLVDHTAVVPATASAATTATLATTTATAAKGGSEARAYLELRRRLTEKGCRYARATSGSSLEVDGVVVRFFAPARPMTMTDGSDPWSLRGDTPTGDELNGSSLVSVASIGTLDVLLPGDAEAEVLQPYTLPTVEIIVVPHHGSRGAVSARLLERLGAQAACISVGKDNSFGHPDPATVSLLHDAVASVLRTDESGWVSFTVKNDRTVLTTERKPGQ
jgi:competence protein ComEC